MAVIESMELAQVLSEAGDIARNVNQRLTSAHLLLAFFVVPNRAEMLLRERGVDEDRILLAMPGAPEEPEGLERDLRERARQVAEGLRADETDCIHLLIAMTRVRQCSAHQLLAACGLELAALRNVALSYYTAGMPRRLRRVPQPANRAPAPPSRRPAQPFREEPADTDLEGEPIEDDGPEPGMLDLSPRPAARVGAPAPAAAPSRTRSPLALDPAEFPWLSQLGRNLTELAAGGRLDPLVGREVEVEQTLDVLGKRRTNNPLLVGEAGVGKTAIVEGVAQRLLAQGSPRVLVELDMASVLSGTQLRGSFSEKLRGIQDEVRRAEGRVVVFIDEVHTVMGAGSTGEGPQDAANELKAGLARGEFPCIGATTHDEYRKHIERDPALERRFTPVLVREPSVPDTLRILQGILPRYEQHHGVHFAPEAVEAAAALTSRYVRDRFLPDKAVAAMDLAGSRARRQGVAEVGSSDVARVVAQMAGIPESRLLSGDRDRLLGLEDALAQRVVGHPETIARVARVLRRNFAGFASRRPMGSFLFLGPTGVGKTELARALADALFGSDQALIRLDMSECSEPTGVARLVGAAPGYVGYGEGGQLTDAVRRRPASVVVLDEIDKAHRDVLLLLLQVLEEGRLTDGRGRQVDFSSTVVVLTTNLGGFEATRTSSGVMGFAGSEAGPTREDRASQAARAALPPELWNRLDERLVFPALSRDDLAHVAALLLRQSSERLAAERRIRFFAGDDVVEHLLANGGFDPSLGARPMRGAVQRLVEGPIAERILAGELVPGDELEVAVESGQLAFRRIG
jgi:ATP-dependent Clp protease ATP-binding subunit ClpC